MSETPKTQKIQTFPVTYWHDDGTFKESIEVRPVPFMGTEGRPGQVQAIAIQEKIIEYVIFKTPAIGAMVVDPEGLQLLKTAAAMMWVLGEPESKRGMDLVNLLNAGDYTQIGQIFVSKTYSQNAIVTPYEDASHFAEIHKMDFWGKFAKARKQKDKMDMNEAVGEIEGKIQAPTISTPPPAVAAGISTLQPI